MKVLIHAGMPKTASTSIQATLEQNRDALRANGILYPAFAGDSRLRGHWQLSAFWYDRLKDENQEDLFQRYSIFGGHDLVADTKQRLESCLRVARTQPADVLLSYEGLGSPAPPQGLLALREFLTQFTDDISVLAYIRPPHDLFASFVQQRLKGLGTPLVTRLPQHIGAINNVLTVFGPERVTLRVFAVPHLKNGNIIDDFLGWASARTGRDLPSPEEEPIENESMNAAACGLLLRLRGALPVSDENRRIYGQTRRLLIEFSKLRAAPKLRLPDAWRATITGWIGASWNDIVEKADHGEQEKAAFRLPPVAADAGLSEADVRRWLETGYDGTHAAEFLRYCRARPEPWALRVASRVAGIV